MSRIVYGFLDGFHITGTNGLFDLIYEIVVSDRKDKKKPITIRNQRLIAFPLDRIPGLS